MVGTALFGSIQTVRVLVTAGSAEFHRARIPMKEPVIQTWARLRIALDKREKETDTHLQAEKQKSMADAFNGILQIPRTSIGMRTHVFSPILDETSSVANLRGQGTQCAPEGRPPVQEVEAIGEWPSRMSLAQSFHSSCLHPPCP